MSHVPYSASCCLSPQELHFVLHIISWFNTIGFDIPISYYHLYLEIEIQLFYWMYDLGHSHHDTGFICPSRGSGPLAKYSEHICNKKYQPGRKAIVWVKMGRTRAVVAASNGWQPWTWCIYYDPGHFWKCIFQRCIFKSAFLKCIFQKCFQWLATMNLVLFITGPDPGNGCQPMALRPTIAFSHSPHFRR